MKRVLDTRVQKMIIQIHSPSAKPLEPKVFQNSSMCSVC